MPTNQDPLAVLLQLLIERLQNPNTREAAGISPPGPSAPTPTPAAPAEPPVPKLEAGSSFSPYQKYMYAQHGLDPDSLRFTRQLGNFMAGLNASRNMFRDALGGQLGNEDIMPGVGSIPGSARNIFA